MARISRKTVVAEPVCEAAPQQIFPTAIYARLSVENSGKSEKVDVIANQIEICKSYIADRPYLSLTDTYIDAGYRGTFVSDLQEQFRLDVDISEKIRPHEWEKLPWRWVVERTPAWLGNSRRLSKDYEIPVASEESMIKISHVHTYKLHEISSLALSRCRRGASCFPI